MASAGKNPSTSAIGAKAISPIKYGVQGRLIFDNGLPAADITVRLYSIGFAGQETKLVQIKSDAQGRYSISYSLARGAAANLQLRVLDSKSKEVTISATRFKARPLEKLNLVVPASVQPLAPEFVRLSADMAKQIGGVEKLGKAEESVARQDLTLLRQASNWDARLIALAATAARQTAATGLGQDVLYALFRVGLPTNLQNLAMVPADTVKEALNKGNQAGIVSLDNRKISMAMTAFQKFAAKTRLAITTPGAVSSFDDLLAAALSDPAQRAAFANLYFSQPSGGSDLWKKAADLRIPDQTLSSLRLQGKLLHLTFNNGPLAQKLQKIVGSIDGLSQMVDKDFHEGAAWKSVLTDLAGAGGDAALQKLIPSIYRGKTTADRLAAYSADLARKVRVAFPTQVVARMIEKKELAVPQASAAAVTSFLKAAAPLGYQLGRTPFHAFVRSADKTLPAMDQAGIESVKTLHRLYQITPSTEALQATMKLGFTSAHGIGSYRKEEFMTKYGEAYPSRDEASLVHARAQQVSSVTFNFFSLAKQVDTAPPVYALSPSGSDQQDARNAIVQQCPSMEGLFGSMDFCQCEECRSVLSPAAYFVDLLEFLRKSAPNAAGYTPLDVLIGKDPTVAGRRPDLGALPLSCENTNTAMPYIDLVNEILEYFIAHSSLGPNAAYDTGSATTADLTAEPQHLLPQVYTTDLKKAVYPLNLPFDLWIETVRGFLNYFKRPLAEVLDTLRPADQLELFTDGHAYPYYRAQILAESLGLSPAEYGVLSVVDPVTHMPSVQHWFQLYGADDENTALNGKLDPTDLTQYLIAPLTSAKQLSRCLGLSYQELTDLVTTGFLNPGLSALTFQLQRFGIGLSDAFSYTGQPGGYDALKGQAKSDFEALLDGITARYKQQNASSTFNAKAWLKSVLPANYSAKVLVLRDPDTGCNFNATTLQYADGSAARPLDFLKLNLFVRLWKKLGWTMEEVDRALQLFFPSNLPAWGDPNFATAFSSAWKTALVYLAHLDDLNTRLAPALGRAALLPLWANLSTHGTNPLYAQLFLTPSVLNNDWAFDDPAGEFPWSSSDPLSAHQSVVQGVTALTSDEVAAILADAGAAVTTVVNGQNVTVPGFSLTNLSICYRYSALAKCLQLPVSDLITLKAMSGLNPFQSPAANPLSVLADDVLLNQALAFVKAVAVVQGSGFTVEDVKYLLRHQFDPVGKYASDPNADMALVQSIANGLRQIQAQNAVPTDVTELSESLIEQSLSGLFPAPILKALFALLTNSQTFTASLGGVAPANKIDPASFAQETKLSFTYDAVTEVQTASYQGVLLGWKKAELLLVDNSPTASALLDGLQLQAQASLERSVGDVLGVWASLARYEAVKTGVAAGLAAGPLIKKDSALSLTYDQADQLQWLAYRGVLTDARKSVLTGVNPSPMLASLLNDVQQQVMPAYRELVGRLLAMWATVQSYEAFQAGVAAADHIDPAVFSAFPEIRLRYDPITQTQTLTYQGVLTEANRVMLAALVPASAVLASLLQTVRNQAVQLLQAQPANLLTVTAADLDDFSQPFLGIDAAKKSKRVKAELVKVFLPLLAQKLSRQLVLQTLTANLAAPASLTEALVTDAAFLTDPSNQGKSLLGAFLAVGRQGVSASYYTSADQSGPALATGTASAPDTADPSNPNANKLGTGSAHFAGYLQVPTDGPYRFFAELGNQNAHVSFRLDSPDPTALFSNPVIQQTAGKDHDEVSQFVQLKGGAAYHFTVDFKNLGDQGASLRLQGENVSKGPLSEIGLYPENAVVGFSRAKILLSKVLQILQVTGLDERELSYVTANASQFSNLKLSALPTQPADDSLASAIALFPQLLALAGYADLRKGPAGGSGSLVDVFENVGVVFTEAAASQDANKNPDTPWRRLANMTRRDPQSVRDVARYFGLIQEQTVGPNRQVTAVADFGNDRGIRRIWEALQLLQITGIPVSLLTASTVIASAAPPASAPTPDLIAANFKNAVKARYPAAAWRPIAQSVFDKLRQKKRDALVAYLVHTLALESSNQLFEYFLVDPGMEPVVQTSRLRLAMSSVQTFIQRCLLNLENGNTSHPQRNVAPSAIEADWWEWMKRYRVWQANREIFLFPENWMEPELRLDKTDLFEDMEGALLQGDVTKDLVEEAFLTYLKGLDLRARLDIVATYLDQDLAPDGVSTLHVLGRTYGTPHKYFYRTYSSGSWSGWQAVTPDIEGDHIVLVVWQGRLNIFWVTFITKAHPADPQNLDPDPTPLSGMNFTQLAGNLKGVAPLPQLQFQLHWTEYFQGKWSPRISTDVARCEVINLFYLFDPSSVFVHVSKELDPSGNDEGAVRIHLDIPGASHAFRVTSKNCNPDFSSDLWEPAQVMPYNASGVDATLHTGMTSLTATFATAIESAESGTPTTEAILGTVNNYALVTCGNPVAPPFLDPKEPLYWEAGGLVSPFFFKDRGHLLTLNERTFFVQPILTEQTMQKYQGWAIAPSGPDKSWYDPNVLKQIDVAAQVPEVGPGPVEAADPVYSVFSMKHAADWATGPVTAISYGSTWVGKSGGANAGNVSTPGSMIRVGGQGLNVNQLLTMKTAAGKF